MKKICIITGTVQNTDFAGIDAGNFNRFNPGTTSYCNRNSFVSDFGLTYQTIEYDGFCINEKVEILLSSDTGVGMAKSLGLGVISFAEVLGRLHPDILVLLGDRYEILAARTGCHACSNSHRPYCRRKITEGAVDEFIRHAINKNGAASFCNIRSIPKKSHSTWRTSGICFLMSAVPESIILRKCSFFPGRNWPGASLNFDLGKRFFHG
jgi:hypothetical protein